MKTLADLRQSCRAVLEVEPRRRLEVLTLLDKVANAVDDGGDEDFEVGLALDELGANDADS